MYPTNDNLNDQAHILDAIYILEVEWSLNFVVGSTTYSWAGR